MREGNRKGGNPTFEVFPWRHRGHGSCIIREVLMNKSLPYQLHLLTCLFTYQSGQRLPGCSTDLRFCLTGLVYENRSMKNGVQRRPSRQGSKI